MSRSRRRKPFVGSTTAKSEKKDKRFAARATRKRNRDLVKKYRGEEDIPQLDPREVRNTWCFDKDGKHMLIDGEDSIYMRK